MSLLKMAKDLPDQDINALKPKARRGMRFVTGGASGHKDAMRKQYHFRKSENGFNAWDMDRLLALSKDFAVIDTPLNEIAELDEDYWFAGSSESPTCRKIVEHCSLINDADLSFPVILCSDGRVMDGMHRVAKALLAGRRTIKAVRFRTTPEPDHVDVRPEELTYIS